MSRKLRPLLCELHAHTTWSDGALTPPQLVDLYGRHGFDVLCVTDHAVPGGSTRAVGAARHPEYVAELEREASRARSLYDLLLVPGLELTFDDEDPTLGAHAVAVGLRSFVDLEHGLDAALSGAREQGAALIAAHPYAAGAALAAPRRTARWAGAWRELAPAVDRFELVNRNEFFHWVSAAGLRGVATGDFHRPEHLATWKTLLPCAKDEASLVNYLRSSGPAYLVDLTAAPDLRLAA